MDCRIDRHVRVESIIAEVNWEEHPDLHAYIISKEQQLGALERLEKQMKRASEEDVRPRKIQKLSKNGSVSKLPPIDLEKFYGRQKPKIKDENQQYLKERELHRKRKRPKKKVCHCIYITIYG